MWRLNPEAGTSIVNNNHRSLRISALAPVLALAASVMSAVTLADATLQNTAVVENPGQSIFEKYAEQLGPDFEADMVSAQRKQALALQRTRQLLEAGARAVQTADHHIDLHSEKLERTVPSSAINQ